MRNFYRALREAWRYWPLLTAAMLCSIFAAVLWGANIVLLFPIVEATVHGDNLQTWNEKRIAESREKIQSLEADSHAMATVPATGADLRERQSQQDRIQNTLLAEQATLQSRERLQPWLNAWMPDSPLRTVLLVLALVVCGTLLKQLFGVANAVLVSYVSLSIARDLRMQVFGKAVALDRRGFHSLGISSFMTTITQTTDGVAQGITAFYGGLLSEPLRIISCLSLAFYLSWRLTLASLIFMPLMVWLIIWLNRRIRDMARQAWHRTRAFHHIMLEVFSALATVQANTMEEFERERFRKATGHMRRIGVQASFYSALANPITEVFGVAVLCTGLGAALYLVISQETHIFGIPLAQQRMSVTELTVVFGLLIGATEPLRKLSGAISGVNTGSAAANLLYPLLDAESQIVDAPEPRSVSRPHRAIEFRDVTFSYDGQHHVLTRGNLKIPFGERLAVVGANGSGKSTLMNLLCRFYDPQSGAVLVDGVSLRDLSVRDLRSRIAIVSQQSDFFNESVLHNIRYGRWDATDEEVVEAAKKARAHDFICGFAEGYQTLVGANGQRLSGGQRQRIALARALLRNAEILILDEATSQIDVESEDLIHEALLEQGCVCTMIMVTHRPSTLRLATRVIRVAGGELIEVAGVDRAGEVSAAG